MIWIAQWAFSGGPASWIILNFDEGVVRSSFNHYNLNHYEPGTQGNGLGSQAYTFPGFSQMPGIAVPQ
jgi:hypothetical protein